MKEISVENIDFSTLSTSFSTACFLTRPAKKLCILVYISSFDKVQLFPIF